MALLLHHPKTLWLKIALYKAGCQQHAMPAELRMIDDVKSQVVAAADPNTLVTRQLDAGGAKLCLH